MACEHLCDLVMDVDTLRVYASLKVWKNSLVNLLCPLFVHSSFQISSTMVRIALRSMVGECEELLGDAADNCLIAVLAFWFAIAIPLAIFFFISRSFM